MMRRIALALAVTVVAGGLALMSWDVALAQTAGAAKEVASPKAPAYVGVTKCKMCHSADAKGAQYKVWAASPHAKAFATLATPEAAEVAKKAGVTGSPQQAPQCLECHTTGCQAPAEARAAVKPRSRRKGTRGTRRSTTARRRPRCGSWPGCTRPRETRPCARVP